MGKNQEEIAKLQSNLSEEKANNDGLSNKLKASEDQNAAMKTSEDNLKKDYEALKAENSKQADEYKAFQAESEQKNEESQGKIDKLENELKNLKQNSEEESKTNEERVQNLEKQVEDLKNSVNEKNESTAQLTQELTDAQQEIEKYKNNEAALNSEVESLKETVAKEQELMNTKQKEFNDEMNKKQTEMDSQLQKKEAKLTAKLEQFANAETQIQQLEVNLEAERQNLENEKKTNQATVATYIKKEERIHNSCKSLFTKFTGIRDEMKSVQEEQISQLEEVSTFFGDFAPLLAKVFEFNQGMIDDLLTKYKRELSLRRKYFNMVQDLRGNIRVFCRFRPLLPFELKKNYTECVKFPQEGQVDITDDKGKKLKFEYDQVYTPKTTQEQVTEDATEYIQS